MTTTYRTTKIQWTQHTWNPIRGCTKISAGCDNCYAEKMAKRFPDRTGPFNRHFEPTMYPDRLEEPLRWKKPRMVFVGSMGDIFHKDIPTYFLHDLFATMAANPKHTFQLLTKREDRMHEFLTSDYFTDGFQDDYGKDLEWPLPNVWLGVTGETQEDLNRRAWKLLACPAAVRFVSIEPLIGPIDLNAGALLCSAWRRGFTIGKYLDWVVVGGETGPRARVCDEDWVRDIWRQCFETKVPFFFKQKGPNWKGNTSGVYWEERREWPQQINISR